MATKHHKENIFSAKVLAIEASGIGCNRWTLAICDRGCWCTMLFCLNPWTASKKQIACFRPSLSVCRGLARVFFQTHRFFSSSRSPRSSSSRPPPRVPPSPESHIGLRSLRFEIAFNTFHNLWFSHWFWKQKSKMNFGKTSFSPN